MKSWFAWRTLHADSYIFSLQNAPCMQIHAVFFAERTLLADSYEFFLPNAPCMQIHMNFFCLTHLACRFIYSLAERTLHADSFFSGSTHISQRTRRRTNRDICRKDHDAQWTGSAQAALWTQRPQCCTSEIHVCCAHDKCSAQHTWHMELRLGRAMTTK